MIEIKDMKRNDPVVIISGDLKGRLAHFCTPYPYPDGDTQCIVELVGGKVVGGKSEKVMLGIEELVAINTPPAELLPGEKKDPDFGDISDYKIGQRVIITKEGKYRGWAGIVRDIIPRAGGCLIDYEVEPVYQDENQPRIAMKIREEDLVPAGYSKMNIKGFDVGKYLKREDQQSIALQIYEDAVKEFVDLVLKRRTIGNTSITDWILSEVAKKYCDELAPQYHDDFLERIKAEIAKDVPKDKDEYGESFSSMFTSALSRCAEDYINSHTEEIQQLMVASIKKAADNVSTDSLASVLRRHVNIEKIMREAFASSKEDKKDGHE